jgi:hypothetical protein
MGCFTRSGLRVLDMAFDPKRQRFKALNDLEGIERR